MKKTKTSELMDSSRLISRLRELKECAKENKVSTDVLLNLSLKLAEEAITTLVASELESDIEKAKSGQLPYMGKVLPDFWGTDGIQ